MAWLPVAREAAVTGLAFVKGQKLLKAARVACVRWAYALEGSAQGLHETVHARVHAGLPAAKEGQVTKKERPARISVQLDADQIELIDLWRRRWPVKEEQFSRSGAIRHAVNVFLSAAIAKIEDEDGISLPLDQKARIQAQLEAATRTKWKI